MTAPQDQFTRAARHGQEVSKARAAVASMSAHTMTGADAATEKVVDISQAGDSSRSNP